MKTRKLMIVFFKIIYSDVDAQLNLNFDLNLLVVFDALFETRSATLAGQRLGRTQSAISNSLKKLRQAMDDPLFVRSPNGLVPTARAEEIQDQVCLILAQTKVCLDGAGQFNPATSTGHICIGAPDRMSLPMMLPFINKVLLEAPGISLQLQTTDRQQALMHLKNETIDIAVGWFDRPPHKFNSKYLFQEELVCLCRVGHPVLSDGNSLVVKQLLKYPHLVVSSGGDGRAAFDELLAQEGITRRIAVSVNNFSAVPSVLLNSDLIGIYTQSIAKTLAETSRLVFVDISIDIKPLDHYMVWNKRFETDLRHQWLRNQLIEVVKS